MGVNYPSGVIKNIVPIVMAGVLGIYGLIVAVIITQDIRSPDKDGSNSYSMFNGYAHVSNLSEKYNNSNQYIASCRSMLWSVVFSSRRDNWNDR